MKKVIKQFKFFCGCLFLLLAAACSTDAEVKNVAPPFFDLKAFFAEERIALKKVKAYTKEIQLDDKSEQQKLDSLDLSIELALFIKSDINKPAWLDQYKIDSLFDAKGQLHHIHYRAMDEDLRTRSLSIAFSDSGQVDSLFVHNASSSMVAESDEWLSYIPQYGYQIKNRQLVTAQSEHTLTVDVKFVY